MANDNIQCSTLSSPATAPTTTVVQDPRVMALDQLISRLKMAIADERSLDERPGYQAAMEKADGLEKQLEDAADAIFAQEPATMADLVVRARLLEYWNEQQLDCPARRDQASHELVRAVLTLAGLRPMQANTADGSGLQCRSERLWAGG